MLSRATAQRAAGVGGAGDHPASLHSRASAKTMSSDTIRSPHPPGAPEGAVAVDREGLSNAVSMQESTVSAHDPVTLLAETRAFNSELERLLATMPSVHTVPPEQTRRARREGGSIFPAPVFLPNARTVEID